MTADLSIEILAALKKSEFWTDKTRDNEIGRAHV